MNGPMDVELRTKVDMLDQCNLPTALFHGIRTLGSVENFPASGAGGGHFPDFVRALATVTLKAAREESATVFGTVLKIGRTQLQDAAP